MTNKMTRDEAMDALMGMSPNYVLKINGKSVERDDDMMNWRVNDGYLTGLTETLNALGL